MKSEYDFSKLKRRGHPLREKIDRGEVKLLDPFNVPEEDFNAKLANLNPDEREFIISIRNSKYANVKVE